MPRRRKDTQFDFTNTTAKQMRRKKPININHLKEINPLTDNQTKVFDAYDEDNIRQEELTRRERMLPKAKILAIKSNE